eukprot:2472915-Pyramimonas_sp.AAC.1
MDPDGEGLGELDKRNPMAAVRKAVLLRAKREYLDKGAHEGYEYMAICDVADDKEAEATAKSMEKDAQELRDAKAALSQTKEKKKGALYFKRLGPKGNVDMRYWGKVITCESAFSVK